ncbi:hypothetical protein J437_LFUL014173 [Ladona fulva]|uniref:DDE Tnp4 domain-containing protein n=1 Tax=Ladona fulva TaxID=123851 RepID=A0A8K0K8L2_LADFU|nr:hypothetical protein J437_LFUL014173 [Ladona fulva]
MYSTFKATHSTDIPVPHVIIGDEGFALQTYLMRPYPKAGIITDPRKRGINAQLSRARRVVETAFGILAMKLCIFLRSIEADVETTDCIVKAVCSLHNYIMMKNNDRKCSNESEEDVGPIQALFATVSTNRRKTTAAMQVRETFTDYFYKM